MQYDWHTMTDMTPDHLPESEGSARQSPEPLRKIEGVAGAIRQRIVDDALAAEEREGSVDTGPLANIIEAAYQQADISSQERDALYGVLRKLGGEADAGEPHTEPAVPEKVMAG